MDAHGRLETSDFRTAAGIFPPAQLRLTLITALVQIFDRPQAGA